VHGSTNELIITTAQGHVRGPRGGGTRLCVQLPQLPAAWDDVRDATTPGPDAPQFTRPFPELDFVSLVGKGWVPGDDFLTLNVSAPDTDSAVLPVIAFIDGGTFVLGSKDASVTNGSAFARSRVVCCTASSRPAPVSRLDPRNLLNPGKVLGA
jgi:carboxylesterase type B